MAYDVNTDYKAKETELKKQLAAATDSVTKAALQAQIDANDVSRTQKLASDLTAYGKYATDSELNSAAGLQAQNQIGTQYETQAKNINTYFDTAKQNANNDALSRGMARSSFVSDRMAGLDTSRATALTDNDAAKALAIQNAQANILSNYRTNAANQLANEKAEFADNKMTYYNDYQAEIDKVLGDNDPTNDWKADKLKGWRNEKLLAQEAAALKAAQKSYSGTVATDDGGVDPNNPFGTTTQRTSTYGNSTVSEVNTALNNGFTPQEVMAAAKEKYGVNSKQYQEIVSAVLRQR